MNELKALDREVQRSKKELDEVKPLYDKQVQEEEEMNNRYMCLSGLKLGQEPLTSVFSICTSINTFLIFNINVLSSFVLRKEA